MLTSHFSLLKVFYETMKTLLHMGNGTCEIDMLTETDGHI